MIDPKKYILTEDQLFPYSPPKWSTVLVYNLTSELCLEIKYWFHTPFSTCILKVQLKKNKAMLNKRMNDYFLQNSLLFYFFFNKMVCLF